MNDILKKKLIAIALMIPLPILLIVLLTNIKVLIGLLVATGFSFMFLYGLRMFKSIKTGSTT